MHVHTAKVAPLIPLGLQSVCYCNQNIYKTTCKGITALWRRPGLLSVKGNIKRGVIVQARTASSSIREAFSLFMSDDARCGSKQARWRSRVSFIKEENAPWDCRRASPSRQGTHSSLCLDGPTENTGASPPTRKAFAREIQEKSGRFSNTYELP
jgi:hypothetical protein